MEIRWMTSCGSTNEEMKKLLEELCGRPADLAAMEQPPAIAALEQTAGKGRRGRSFASPNGQGLYLSVPLEICAENGGISMEQALCVMPMASVCVCRALDALCHIRCDIKWPNDVLWEEKKLCGILTELVCCGERSFLILGIGINLSQKASDFPQELREKATSIKQIQETITRRQICKEKNSPLKQTCEQDISPQAMAAALLPQIADMINALSEDRTKCREYLAFYRSRCVTIGKYVDVIFSENDIPRQGESLAVTEDYGLLIQWEDESTEVLKNGEVSIRRK